MRETHARCVRLGKSAHTGIAIPVTLFLQQPLGSLALSLFYAQFVRMQT
jgi:hypothetical protein